MWMGTPKGDEIILGSTRTERLRNTPTVGSDVKLEEYACPKCNLCASKQEHVSLKWLEVIAEKLGGFVGESTTCVGVRESIVQTPVHGQKKHYRESNPIDRRIPAHTSQPTRDRPSAQIQEKKKLPFGRMSDRHFMTPITSHGTDILTFM